MTDRERRELTENCPNEEVQDCNDACESCNDACESADAEECSDC